MMDQLESLEKTSGDLERENVKLKWERDHLEVKVEEENRRILSLLLDNNAGQNTEVQNLSQVIAINNNFNIFISFNVIYSISHNQF
jgi:ACT domain-containing protein